MRRLAVLGSSSVRRRRLTVQPSGRSRRRVTTLRDPDESDQPRSRCSTPPVGTSRRGRKRRYEPAGQHPQRPGSLQRLLRPDWGAPARRRKRQVRVEPEARHLESARPAWTGRPRGPTRRAGSAGGPRNGGCNGLSRTARRPGTPGARRCGRCSRPPRPAWSRRRARRHRPAGAAGRTRAPGSFRAGRSRRAARPGRARRTNRRDRSGRSCRLAARDRNAGDLGRKCSAQHHGDGDCHVSGRQGSARRWRSRHHDRLREGACPPVWQPSVVDDDVDGDRSSRNRGARRWLHDDRHGLRAVLAVGR
jgi:hypothetical protein